MSLLLTQHEADDLLALEKVYLGNESVIFPGLGGSLNVPLYSLDQRENFMLDISVGRIVLSKKTLQNRARKTVVLVRLDIGGSPHRNPDDTVIECPHLHLYREGFGVKWAYPLPPIFDCVSNTERTLFQFMGYCNITGEIPIIMELQHADDTDSN